MSNHSFPLIENFISLIPDISIDPKSFKKYYPISSLEIISFEKNEEIPDKSLLIYDFSDSFPVPVLETDDKIFYIKKKYGKTSESLNQISKRRFLSLKRESDNSNEQNFKESFC